MRSPPGATHFPVALMRSEEGKSSLRFVNSGRSDSSERLRLTVRREAARVGLSAARISRAPRVAGRREVWARSLQKRTAGAPAEREGVGDGVEEVAAGEAPRSHVTLVADDHRLRSEFGGRAHGQCKVALNAGKARALDRAAEARTGTGIPPRDISTPFGEGWTPRPGPGATNSAADAISFILGGRDWRAREASRPRGRRRELVRRHTDEPSQEHRGPSGSPCFQPLGRLPPCEVVHQDHAMNLRRARQLGECSRGGGLTRTCDKGTTVRPTCE